MNLFKRSVNKIWKKRSNVIVMSALSIFSMNISAEVNSIWNFEYTDNFIVRDYNDGRDAQIMCPGLSSGDLALAPGKLGEKCFTTEVIDGTNKMFAFLEVPSHADLNNLYQISFAAWVWVPNTRENTSSGLDGNLGIMYSGTTKRPFGLYIDTCGYMVFEVNQGTGVGGLGTGIYKSTLDVKYGGWHHVAVTYDRAKIRFYVDGHKDPKEYSATLQFGATNEPLRFGALERNSDSPYFPLNNGLYGQMDDIRLCTSYDVFTQGEIADFIRLKGLWDMNNLTNGKVLDQSGIGADATPFNGALLAPGLVSKSISLDGINDYLCGNFYTQGWWGGYTKSLTLSAWIRPTSLKDNAGIVTWGKTICPYQWLLMADGSLVFAINTPGTTAGSGYTSWRSSLKLTAGAWHHIVVTYDGSSKIHFYIDGVKDPLDHFSNNSSIGFAMDENLVMGGNIQGNSYFKGLLDQVAMYDRPLTHLEILEQRKATMLISWDFNETPVTDRAQCFGVETGTRVNGPVHVAFEPVPLDQLKEFIDELADSAYTFDGVNDYIKTSGNVPSLFGGGNNLTVIAQIKPSALRAGAGIVTIGTGSVSPWSFQIGSVSGATAKLRFSVNRGNPSGYARTGTYESDYAINKDQYAHVAVTYDGSNIIFYVDGKAVKTHAIPGIVFGTVASPLTVGVDFPGTDEYYTGLINDIQVYSRALTPSELITPDYAREYWKPWFRGGPSQNCYNYGTNYDTYYPREINFWNASPTGYDVDGPAELNVALVALGFIPGTLYGPLPPGYARMCVFLNAGLYDFHFYRQDRDLTWSHKPGTGTIRNQSWNPYNDGDAGRLFYGGDVITDPVASSAWYNVFVGYYYMRSSPLQGLSPGPR